MSSNISGGSTVLKEAGQELSVFLQDFFLKGLEEENNIEQNINTIIKYTEENYGDDVWNQIDNSIKIDRDGVRELLGEFFSQNKIYTSEDSKTLVEVVHKLNDIFDILKATSESKFKIIEQFIIKQFVANTIRYKKNKKVTDLEISRNKKAIEDLRYKNLDYFIGDGENYYLKTSKSGLYFNNGENPDIKVLSAQILSGEIGSKFYIGGDSVVDLDAESVKIKELVLTRQVKAEHHIVMSDGKELIGTALRARYADLAENYTADEELKYGYLASFNINQTVIGNEIPEVIKYKIDLGTRSVAGVVTKNPGFILDHDLDKRTDLPLVCLALKGKTPIRLDKKGNVGDYIYPSYIQNGLGTPSSEYKNEPIGRILSPEVHIKEVNGVTQYIYMCKI